MEECVPPTGVPVEEYDSWKASTLESLYVQCAYGSLLTIPPLPPSVSFPLPRWGQWCPSLEGPAAPEYSR